VVDLARVNQVLALSAAYVEPSELISVLQAAQRSGRAQISKPGRRIFFDRNQTCPAALRELKPRTVLIGHNGRWKSDDLKKNASPDRSKISHEVKWTEEFGVNRDQLQKLVDKVVNSAASVRKELAT
jgi:Protein of unknown function (DUF3606)